MSHCERLRKLIPVLAICGGLIAASAHHYPPERPVVVSEVEVEVKPEPRVPVRFDKAIRPLADIISSGEGDWNAVNRGVAGDTPGGLQSLLGHTCEKLMIGELLRMQNSGQIYAVGRYQFIPSTLRYAVQKAGISHRDFFRPDVQDKLFAVLVEEKRPSVAAYLRGETNNIDIALDDLAKEWASIEYRNGRGYHDRVGGNRAHISRVDVKEILKDIRKVLS